MDWETITPLLQKKLDPKNVRPAAKDGPKGDYIEGWFAIDEANAIFGFGAWSYTIKGLTKDFCEEVEKEGRNGSYKQWQAAYTCIVTLTVGDAVREDVGFGSGYGKNRADAIEGATKEAVTDALKRCLRTFGNRFGLALYDKSRVNVGVDPQPRDPNAVAASLIGIMERAETMEAVNKALGSAKFDDAWTWLDEHSPDHGLQVRRAVDAARDKFTAKEAAE